MWGWILLGLLATAGIAAFLYWQLIIAEGVYFGQKTVTLLYDRVAHKYNDIKEFDERDERLYLALPLSQAIGFEFDSILLDVATGTGRLPAAMTTLPHFRGQVIAIDHSVKMLLKAKEAMPDASLLMADAMRLPFPSEAVGAVTCLEALEFFPSPQGALAEMTRTLSTGGVLLTTNRIGWETKFMPGKVQSSAEMKESLEQLPLSDISINPWLNIYDQVWARKKKVLHG